MGWLTFNKPSHIKPLDYLEQRVLRWNVPEEAHPKVVARAITYTCAFFAVQCPKAYLDLNPGLRKHYIPASDGSITTAIVILISRAGENNENGNFGYKDMDELSGPHEIGVGRSFIAKLSQIRHSELQIKNSSASYAQAWRTRCLDDADRRTAKRKIVEGSTIELAEPLKFGDAYESRFVAKRMLVRGRNRKSANSLVFQAQTGLICNLRPCHIANATITPPTATSTPA